jgi:hypothetical protein
MQPPKTSCIPKGWYACGNMDLPLYERDSINLNVIEPDAAESPAPAMVTMLLDFHSTEWNCSTSFEGAIVLAIRFRLQSENVGHTTNTHNLNLQYSTATLWETKQLLVSLYSSQDPKDFVIAM